MNVLKNRASRFLPVCRSSIRFHHSKHNNIGGKKDPDNRAGNVENPGKDLFAPSGSVPIVLNRGGCNPPPELRTVRGDTQTDNRADCDLEAAGEADQRSVLPDYGPLRPAGLWKMDDVVDVEKATVDFRRIDEMETDVMESLSQPEDALVHYDEEERWKHKLMFVCKFKKSPKHLTWTQLGEEIECMDCVIDVDKHRPEEIFTISFYFTDKKSRTRDILWSARNDVSSSEGLTDLLAAVGACLGRSDVHRTIRFDDGVGVTRDISIRKASRYTSDITIAFRPAELYNKYERKSQMDEYEKCAAAEEMSVWGFHPALMDRDYNTLDFEDPPGTYTIALSAHAFSFIVLRCIKRLLSRPMKDFYRPSQLMRTAKVRTHETIGLGNAMKGWMGVEELVYPHYTPVEAIQEHWLGKDAPFSLVAIINKLREMTYLKAENPEFQSWLSVRHHDTHTAIRNLKIKMLGVGASSLFLPASHNPTVNRLLPKSQQRRLESSFSLNALLGMPDETRKIDEFKKLAGCEGTAIIENTSDNHNKKDNEIIDTK
uniref:Uncharacterized protein TCIL3000_11_14990 n=1 Tax=Trypanosoma congolense (strain IL3000) TaxID=1068625 RepID=G0V2V9_TRYCI|nr:unnamed protein product [Trypanosoma congolense IL3000]